MGNYYRLRDILPSYQLASLGQAKIVITNFHAFLLRERVKAGKLTKSLLSGGGNNPFQVLANWKMSSGFADQANSADCDG